MAKAVEKRIVISGVEKTAFYVGEQPDRRYGEAWSGIFRIGVSGHRSSTALYADDRKYGIVNGLDLERYAIECAHIPDNMLTNIGKAWLTTGALLSGQAFKSFGLVWCSKVLPDYGHAYPYILNIVWNVTAKISEVKHRTTTYDADLDMYMLEGVPSSVILPDGTVCERMEIDCRYLKDRVVKKMFDLLFGTETTRAQLPGPYDFIQWIYHALEEAEDLEIPVHDQSELDGRNAISIIATSQLSTESESMLGTRLILQSTSVSAARCIEPGEAIGIIQLQATEVRRYITNDHANLNHRIKINITRVLSPKVKAPASADGKVGLILYIIHDLISKERVGANGNIRMQAAESVSIECFGERDTVHSSLELEAWGCVVADPVTESQGVHVKLDLLAPGMLIATPKRVRALVTAKVNAIAPTTIFVAEKENEQVLSKLSVVAAELVTVSGYECTLSEGKVTASIPVIFKLPKVTGGVGLTNSLSLEYSDISQLPKTFENHDINSRLGTMLAPHRDISERTWSALDGGLIVALWPRWHERHDNTLVIWRCKRYTQSGSTVTIY